MSWLYKKKKPNKTIEILNYLLEHTILIQVTTKLILLKKKNK